MNNVLFVNKPKGISSFDVCYKLRKVLNTKRIGHTGTLDPNATGVMIVLFNEATKLSQFLVGDTKEYETRVVFGIETDTLDITGNIINKSNYVVPKENEIVNALNSFLGKSKQEVPITSAKKINGKKLYEYQLKNIDIELPVIEINVFDIKLNNLYDDGFSFTCKVSSGTYIRSLVRDILKKLNLIGTVSELNRTMVNNISIDDCDDLQEIIDGKYSTHNEIELLSNSYKIYEIENIGDVKNGKRVKINSDENRIVLVNNNQLLAIYEKDGNEYKCVRGLW